MSTQGVADPLEDDVLDPRIALSYVDGTGVERTPSDATIAAINAVLTPAPSPTTTSRTVGDSARLPVEIPHGSTVGDFARGRRWGVFMALSALRRTEAPDHGLGDLRGLRELADIVADLGGSVVATLPLCATRPDEASPYSPLTRRYFDERWVDPEWIADDLGIRAPAPRPAADGALADSEHAYHSTRSALADLFERAEARAVVRGWRVEQPDVERWARFKAAAQRYGFDPSTWSPPLSAAIRSGDGLAEHNIDPDDVTFEVFCQWAVQRQLRCLHAHLRDIGVALYLDLPVGVSASSFDVWDRPEWFATTMSIGAPADRFFPGGQNWGLRPVNPTEADRSDHAYYRACLEAHMSVCHMLRIDHVMGLHRLFWIPDGAEDGDGTYVSSDADRLWDITEELAALHGVMIVGEDVGNVPDEVRTAMAQRSVAGLFLGQDELRDPFRLARPVPAGAVASLNTHDLAPFAQWHSTSTLRGDAAVARDHVVAELAASAASVVLVSDQDLALDDRRFNLPGTVGGTTWRNRTLITLEELTSGALGGGDARRLLGNLDVWRRTERGAWPNGSAPAVDAADIASLHAGTHARLADRFGLHPTFARGMVGCSAAVWAPHAMAVIVAGDFDGWTGTPLREHGTSGVWNGFLASAVLGDRYKLRIETADGRWLEKADPFGRSFELPPGNASIVTASDPATDGDHQQWSDHEWMASRAERQRPGAPISIYELHLGSWRYGPDGEPLSYRALAPQLVQYCHELGFTHVEFLPVMEHPFGGSWGYHVTGFFAPTSRFGTAGDFAALIDELHRGGIGVILDWVPAHFPEDAHGLVDFDGEALFEYADPQMGRHPEWGSRVFDFGRNEVRAFLTSSARWWVDHFHIDGLRVDAVASMIYRNYARPDGEWVPNVDGGKENYEALSFIRQLNDEIHTAAPGVLMIAEESTSWPGVTAPTAQGGLGFDLKWDLGWMHDTLDYLERDSVHRSWHQNDLTFRAMYATSEQFVLPLSHDEVVHGKASLAYKMAGDDWQRQANLRALYAVQWTTPGVPLLFMGGELAMNEEWNHDAELPWWLLQYDPHRGVQRWVGELNRIKAQHPALSAPSTDPHTFEWLDCSDRTNSVVSWVRRVAGSGGRDLSGVPRPADLDEIMVIANFTPNPHDGYRVPVPSKGRWNLIANSDNLAWGGSDYWVSPMLEAEPVPWAGWEHSALVSLAPLSVTMWSRR